MIYCYPYNNRKFTLTAMCVSQMLKVGYTTRKVADRIAEQYPVKTPNQSYQLELEELALRDDGSYFTDHDVHQALAKMGVQRAEGEWFHCDVEQVQAAIVAVRNRKPPKNTAL